MRALVLTMAVVGQMLVAPVASAITEAELPAAIEILRQIDGAIDSLRDATQAANRGQIGRVPLVAAQKITLRGEYDTEKAALQALVLTLP